MSGNLNKGFIYYKIKIQVINVFSGLHLCQTASYEDGEWCNIKLPENNTMFT